MLLLAGSLGGSLLVAGAAGATTTTLYVSPSGASAHADTSCSTAAYSTVQAAVTAATSGDTIQVCAGTYTGPVSVAIAGLTIKGTGATASTVKVSGTSDVVFAIGNTAGTTKIEDLTISGGSDGVYSNQGASNLTVSDNTFTTVFRTGAAVNSYGPTPGPQATGVTISGNRMTGPGAGVALFNTKSVEVNANTIVHSQTGNTGLYLGGSDSTVTITGNHFANDSSAIYVGIFPANTPTTTLGVNKTTTVHLNSFDTTDDYSSTVGAVFVASGVYTGVLDATDNWWGCATGPNTSGCATTAGTSSGAISTSPWLAVPPPLYVSPSGTSTNADTSCSTAAYTSIQSAVNAAVPGDTVDVCAGTYAEQVSIATTNLTITGPTSGSPAIIEPSAVACNTTDLDTGVPTAAAVLVAGVSGVTVEHLSVNGATGGASTFTGCASSPQNFWGVVYQNASGSITDNSVVNFTPSTTFSGGNNNDAGIYVQSSTGSSVVTVAGNTVSGYQKNGITCNDAHTACTVKGNVVTGAGPISTEAQNGIQLGFGATGSVSGNTVADDNCTASSSIGTASGILIIQASDTSVTGNSVSDSQQAIVLQSFGGYTRTAGASMAGDTVSGNRITYSSGYSSNSANATNTTVGIDVAAFNFGASAPSVSALIQQNTVDGPGTFGQTSSTISVKSPVGMEVGYLASSSEYGDLTVRGTGNTFENWAADVMDVGTTHGTDATTVAGNNLLGPSVLGVDNASGSASGTTPVTTNAVANWWGSASGPYNPSTNPSGTGSPVSTHVSYRPWCTRFACSSPPPPPPPPPATTTTPPAPPKTSTDPATGSSSTQTGTTGDVTSSDSVTKTTVSVDATGIGGITVAQYTANPVTKEPFTTSTSATYFDIEVSAGNSFTSVSVKVCSPNTGAGVDWYTGSAWEPVVGDPGPTATSGTPPCVSFTLTASSTPSISQLTGSVFATASVAPRVTTVYGQTADATAAAEFTRAFPSTKGACPSSRAAVIATTKEFQDALSSQSLAAHLTTGTLLTPTESLDQVTATTLKDEGITTVYLVGGPLAITTTVASAIGNLTAYGCGGSTASGKIAVHRLAGTTQYGTAEAIAEFVGTASSLAFPGAYAGSNATGGTGKYNDTAGKGSSAPAGAVPSGAVPTAILASGEEFQDAQAASVVSYHSTLPLLLTPATTLSTTAVAAIQKLGIKQVILMGGPLAVTNTVESALVAKTGVAVLRVAGKDYTDTARELARFEAASSTAGLGWTVGHRVMVARGNGFTDGLCGAVLENPHNTQTGAPGTTRPLLLTESPTTVGTYLTTFLKVTGHTGIDGKAGATVTALTVLGGPLAVSTAEISAMQADLAD